MRLKATLISVAALAAIAGSSPAGAQWTGCGIGAGGSFIQAEAAVGPVGLGAQGEKAGATVNCDYRLQAFVTGLEVNYDWFFGDLHTLGAKTELSVVGRFGVLTNPGNLLYVAAGWGNTDVQAGPFKVHVDSWKLGLGDEFRIPNSPVYLDLRAMYSRYDEKDIHPSLAGVKIDSLEAGARLKVKFGPGMFGGKGPMFTNEEDPKPPRVTDPKLPR